MKDTRMTAAAAGYMELAGAEKDGDCHKVDVDDGISTKLGCCNEFEPKSRAVQQFRCGRCEYVVLVMPKRNALAERVAQ